MYVLVADQRASRRHPDLVAAALPLVARLAGGDAALPPERTVGDELQVLLTSARAAIEITLALTRDENWSVGIGVGETERPLPDSVRSARGAAFLLARDAVDQAKKHPAHAVVTARENEGARDVTALLAPVLELRSRRTAAGWEVCELLASGRTQEDAARTLGITQAAVSKRARVAGYAIEREAVPALVTLLTRLDGS